MTIGQVVALRIEELCKEHKITVNKLATKSGITQSTLNNIVNGVSTNPTISTIKKICDGLGIKIIVFFDAEIFNNLEQELK